MKIIRSRNEMSKISQALKRKGNTIGFVPTMGALHQGHISLVKQARQDTDIVVMSIFVNPLQFGPKEDFKKYPRDLKGDCKLARAAGVDLAFYPDRKEMYPEGASTYVRVEGLSD